MDEDQNVIATNILRCDMKYELRLAQISRDEWLELVNKEGALVDCRRIGERCYLNYTTSGVCHSLCSYIDKDNGMYYRVVSDREYVATAPNMEVRLARLARVKGYYSDKIILNSYLTRHDLDDRPQLHQWPPMATKIHEYDPADNVAVNYGESAWVKKRLAETAPETTEPVSESETITIHIGEVASTARHVADVTAPGQVPQTYLPGLGWVIDSKVIKRLRDEGYTHLRMRKADHPAYRPAERGTEVPEGFFKA